MLGVYLPLDTCHLMLSHAEIATKKIDRADPHLGIEKERQSMLHAAENNMYALWNLCECLQNERPIIARSVDILATHKANALIRSSYDLHGATIEFIADYDNMQLWANAAAKKRMLQNQNSALDDAQDKFNPRGRVTPGPGGPYHQIHNLFRTPRREPGS